MKKIIILLVFVLIVGSVTLGLFYFFDKEDEIDADLVVSSIIKNRIEDVAPFIGATFEKRIHDAPNMIDDMLFKFGQVEDFHFVKEEHTKDALIYEYKILTDKIEHSLTLKFTKQPKVFLLDNITYEIGHEKAQELIDQFEAVNVYYDIMDAFLEEDFETLYQYCHESFAQRVNFKIENANELRGYYDRYQWFQNSECLTYEFLSFNIDNTTQEPTIDTLFNKGTEDEFVLTIVFHKDNHNELVGFYFKELNQLLSSGYLFRPPTVVQSDVMKPDSSIPKEAFLNRLGPMKDNLMEKGRNTFIYLKNDKYRMLYYSMTEEFRDRLSYDQFQLYIELMEKRVGFEISYPITDENWTYVYDFYKPYHRYDHVVMDDSFDDMYNPLSEKPDLHKSNNLIMVTEYFPENISSLVEGQKETFISNIYLSRGCGYITDHQYQNLYDYSQNYKLVYQDDFSTDEKTADFWLERMNKSRDIILALKQADYDFLWDLEKKYTAFESKDDMIQLIELQKKIVGSFNGVYYLDKEYLDHQHARYVVTIPFETMVGDYNILYLSFDAYNDLIDFNVGRLPK